MLSYLDASYRSHEGYPAELELVETAVVSSERCASVAGDITLFSLRDEDDNTFLRRASFNSEQFLRDDSTLLQEVQAKQEVDISPIGAHTIVSFASYDSDYFSLFEDQEDFPPRKLDDESWGERQDHATSTAKDTFDYYRVCVNDYPVPLFVTYGDDQMVQTMNDYYLSSAISIHEHGLPKLSTFYAPLDASSTDDSSLLQLKPTDSSTQAESYTSGDFEPTKPAIAGNLSKHREIPLLIQKKKSNFVGDILQSLFCNIQSDEKKPYPARRKAPIQKFVRERITI